VEEENKNNGGKKLVKNYETEWIKKVKINK
jgi:hypothetical protein